MKAIKYILFAIIGIVAFGCSDDKPEESVYDGSVDKGYIMELLDGTTRGTFSMKKCEEQYRWPENDGRWETRYQTGKVFDAGDEDYLNNIYIKDGLWWRFAKKPRFGVAPGYDSYVGYSFSHLWELYCQQTNFNKNLFVVGKLVYDDVNNTIEIYGDRYMVTRAEQNMFSLMHMSPESFNGVISDDTWFVGRYLVSRTGDFLYGVAPDQIITFDTHKEANLWMIARLREYFGDRYLHTVIDDVEYYMDLIEIEEAIRNGNIISYGDGR